MNKENGDFSNRKFQDPVLNCYTCELAERFFCEGDYDELPKLRSQNFFQTSRIWNLNWEDDFLKDEIDFENFDNIVFNKSSFEKISGVFKEFNNKTKFIIDKVMVNLKIYEYENCRCSNFYEYSGNFIISQICNYNNIELLNYLFEKQQIFEYCESWISTLINSSESIIKLAIRCSNLRSLYFESVCQTLVSDENLPDKFFKYSIEYIVKNYETYLPICKNSLDAFIRIFGSFFMKEDFSTFKGFDINLFFKDALEILKNGSSSLKNITYFIRQMSSKSRNILLIVIKENIENFEDLYILDIITIILNKYQNPIIGMESKSIIRSEIVEIMGLSKYIEPKLPSDTTSIRQIFDRNGVTKISNPKN